VDMSILHLPLHSPDVNRDFIRVSVRLQSALGRISIMEVLTGVENHLGDLRTTLEEILAG
jgi:hypothetical protein